MLNGIIFDAIILDMNSATSSNEIPKKPAERAIWVTYQLRMKGLSQSSLARNSGLSRSAISLALRQPSAQVERIIAKALGVKVEALFPERYADDGRRLHQTRPHPKQSRVRRNRKSKAVA